MKPKRVVAALLGMIFGILALVSVLVLEAVLTGMVLPNNVGWDPVSLWHSSISGKLLVLVAIGMVEVPLAIALVAFAVVFAWVYRWFSRRGDAHPVSSS